MNTAAGIRMVNTYIFECFGPDGKLKWREEVNNTTVTEGLNHILNTEFKSGTPVASWFVGLKGSGSIAAADTLASHAGWTEITAYTTNRVALTLGSVSGGSVATSAASSFSMNGGYTVAGAFVCSVNTGSSGTLFGEADFGVARTGGSGDTLNVSVTLSAITQ